MKTSSIVIGLLASINVSTQVQAAGTVTGASQSALPAPTEYRVVDRGANHRVWQRETYEQAPNGKIVPHIHSYTELATGMHYKDASTGQWLESKEEIEAYPSGAIARQGQYQVIFANNLNSAGAIDLQTPDGKRLRSNILGLGYHDSATGQSVLIAQLQDSQGELVSANQVLYPNAFEGVKADVRYTYKKGSFEQDVILREQPPTPESLGLNANTTELEVMTEFIDPPQALVEERNMDKNGDSHQEVSWGAIKLGHGKAFDLEGEQDSLGKVPVKRQYSVVNGRKILLEIVPLSKVLTGLKKLPKQASIKSNRPMTAFNQRVLPKAPLAQLKSRPMKLAAVLPSDKGYVLDYVELNTDLDDFTFQGDTTYLISGGVNLGGLTTIEGGTVIKYAEEGAIIQIWGDVACATAPFRPAIFTSQEDNSVGENVSVGGSLSYFEALYIDDSSTPLHDLRISYATYGIHDHNLNLTDSQFIHCGSAVQVEWFGNGGYSCSLDNVLMSDVNVAVDGTAFTATASQMTVVGCDQLTTDTSGPGYSSIIFTNCLLVDVLAGGDASITTNNTAWTTNATAVFQTVGAGSCYLATNSPYRNVGTTNINPAILANIVTRTTYPPIVYSNTTISVATTFSPQAQRDTDSPDLGYHYDPLDYVFGSCTVNSNIIFTAGTSVGFFTDPAAYSALLVDDSISVTFNGTVTSPCRWSVADTVQEGGNDNWQIQYALGGIVGQSYISIAPAIRANFTICSALASEVNFFRDNWTLLTLCATNCEFWSGNVGGYYASYNLVNCLIVNSQVGLWWNYNSANLSMQDCTMINGFLFADHDHSGNWPVNIMNCAFDQTTFYLNPHANSTNGAYCDYNAFVTNASRLYFLGAHDVILTDDFNWQGGRFGNFYLPTNSPLVNAGSTNANLLALYHFTTQTNQLKETNSIVDIGYHYVATDAYGNPYDTDGDGLPDYWEDSNGNGVNDAGDLSDGTDYYNGVPPVLTIVSGDNQNGTTNAFLPLPLTVSVTATNGTPLTNAPLNFTVSVGGALIATSTNGTLTNSITMRTGTSGQAAVYAYMPTNWQSISRIAVTAWSGTNSVQATFTESASQGLKLWLRADAGVTNTSGAVSVWTDQSGNGNTATQGTGNAQPTYVTNALNNLPVIRFSGGQSFGVAATLGSALASGNQAEAVVVLKSSISAGNQCSLWFLSGNWYDSAYPSTDGSIREAFGSTTSYPFQYNLGVPAQPLTQYHVYEVSAQNSNWSAWINGQMLYHTTNNTFGFYPGSVALGSGWNGNFVGDIAEVMFFNRVLTASERSIVNIYLNAKYGLVPNIPSTPSNLVAAVISPAQISLTWSQVLNGGATRISIERSTSSNGVYTAIAQATAALSYIDTNLMAGTTYYYRVRAINSDQWSDYSDVAQATTLASGSSLPIENLALWLKADAGLVQGTANTPVSYWADQSGKGNDATQLGAAAGRPMWVPGAIGDRPVVRFSGGQAFNMPAMFNGLTGAEAVLVLKSAIASGNQCGLWFLSGNAYDSAYPATDGSIREAFGSTTSYPFQYNLGVPAQPLTQYHVYEVSAQNNNWAAWINGGLLYWTTNNSFGIATGTWTLGYDWNGNFVGDMAEVLIFNRGLTAGERDSVGNYLFSKYGLLQYATNAVPPNAPTNLLTTGLAPYQLQLQWAKTSTNIYSFQIERKLGTNGDYQLIGTVWSVATNFIDTTANPTNAYFYRVKAHNLFGDAPSTAVSPPAINLTNWPPVTTENFTNQIIAQAFDADGTVSNVQFFANNWPVGVAVISPYTINWAPSFSKTYSLTALASDNQGNSQYSASFNVTVYLDSNGDGIPDYLQVSQSNDPLNPWVQPAGDTNTIPPNINLLVPANATLLP